MKVLKLLLVVGVFYVSVPAYALTDEEADGIASDDCKKEAMDQKDACSAAYGAAKNSNQEMADGWMGNVVNSASGVNPQGRTLASMSQTAIGNNNSANDGCVEAKKKLNTFCAASARRANKQIQEAQASGDKAKELQARGTLEKIKQNYKDGRDSIQEKEDDIAAHNTQLGGAIAGSNDVSSASTAKGD